MYQIGQQIAYIPPHAKGDVKHPDTVFGFVYSFGTNLFFLLMTLLMVYHILSICGLETIVKNVKQSI